MSNSQTSSKTPDKVSEVKNNTGAKKPEKDFCCYIGPTILGVVQSGTIFSCTKEEALKSIPTDKYPEIPALIVPGKSLAEAKNNVQKPGTLLNKKFQQLAKR